MKLTEAAKKLNVTIQTAHKLFSEDRKQKTKLGGCWYLTNRGYQLLDELTPDRKARTVTEAANYWLDDDDRADDNRNENAETDKAVSTKISELRSTLEDIQQLLQGNPDLAEIIDGYITDALSISDLILSADELTTQGGMKDEY